MRLDTPHGQFHLSYSTNVHPGETLAEIERLLVRDVCKVRDQAFPGARFGVELRLGAQAAAELATPAARAEFAAFLEAHDLYLFSLNAFLLRDFDAPVIKEEIYRPDWLEPERARVTMELCRLLAACLPEGIAGVVSTLPGSFKPWGDSRGIRAEIARALAPVIDGLHRLRDETGRTVRLAVEPEPFGTLETVDEFIEFYEGEGVAYTAATLAGEFGFTESAAIDAVRAFLAINLDACHLAVEFEDPEKAVEKLLQARVPLAKLHVAAAARVMAPSDNREGLERLARLDEPKYLHQTFAVDRDGRIAFRATDLPEFLALPVERLEHLAEVRTHFHMPLYYAATAALGVTSDISATVLRRVVAAGQGTHIVCETYTWPVLAAGDQAVDVHRGIARELQWTAERMRSV